MKFLGYGDIHYHNGYFSNAVTLSDIEDIDRLITEEAVKRAVACVIFGGDAYKNTQPEQAVSMAAERAWKERCDRGIVTLTCIGNHDRNRRSAISGHAFQRAEIFTKDLSKFIPYDRNTVVHVEDVDVLFMPSGLERQPIDMSNRRLECPLVVVFHGLLKGSYFANGEAVHTGIDPETIKQFKPSLVIGADNHTAQRLDQLLGCPSLYMGAPMYHSMGDRGQTRGFWAFEVTRDGVEMELIRPLSPVPFKEVVQSTDKRSLNVLVSNIKQVLLPGQEAIIELTVQSTKDVDRDEVSTFLNKELPIRSLRLIVQRQFEKIKLVDGFNVKDTPENKFTVYLKAQEIGNLEPNKLIQDSLSIISQAKQEAN